MTAREFTNKIQQLMNIQHTRLNQNVNIKYKWICRKQFPVKLLSTKDEFLIFQAIQTLQEEEKIKAMKQLVDWLENHPHVQVEKIPETYLTFLHRYHTINLINNVTISRRSSIRISLRRVSNKIAPSPVLSTKSDSIIYHISK